MISGQAVDLARAKKRMPDDYNWVEARAKVPDGAFEDLVKRVEADVESHQALGRFRRCESGRLGSALRVWSGGHPDVPPAAGGTQELVSFEVVGQSIHVRRRSRNPTSDIEGRPSAPARRRAPDRG